MKRFFVFIVSIAFLFFYLPKTQANTIEHRIKFVDEKGNTHYEYVTLENRNSELFFEDDIFVGYLQANGDVVDVGYSSNPQLETFGVIKSSNKWGTKVPYSLSGLTNSIANAVREAMNKLENASGLKFLERTTEVDYIYFEYSADSQALCSSPVGKVGGAQRIRLANYCSTTQQAAQKTIMHELMHSLGFYHEHSRNDRDSWVIIHYDNIKDDKLNNYRKVSDNFEYLTPYDKKSIMHYIGLNSGFAKNPLLPTISDLQNSNNPLSGYQLSELDKQSLETRFGAVATPHLNAMPFYCFGQAELSWQAVPRANFYKIFYSNGFGNNYLLDKTYSTSNKVMNARESTYYSIQ